MKKNDVPWSRIIGHLLRLHASDAALADQLRRVAMDESIVTLESAAADTWAWWEILRRYRARDLSEEALEILREIRKNLRRKKGMNPYYATWRRRIDRLLAEVAKRAKA